MRRSITALAATVSALSAPQLATPALGQVIEIRFIGTASVDFDGDPGDTGLENVHAGDPLIVATYIDLGVASDTHPGVPQQSQFVGDGVTADGQAGSVFLDTETPTFQIYGDTSEFGGPPFDLVIVHGGTAGGVPVHAFVRLDPSIIATDTFAPPLDLREPDLLLGQITLTPYLGVLWGEVTRVTVRDVTCPADLAAPFGSLDFSDVAAFVSAFASGEPTGDPAMPLGVHDFSDVVEFLAAFGAGCP